MSPECPPTRIAVSRVWEWLQQAWEGFAPPSSSAVVTPSGVDTLRSFLSQGPFVTKLDNEVFEFWHWLRWYFLQYCRGGRLWVLLTVSPIVPICPIVSSLLWFFTSLPLFFLSSVCSSVSVQAELAQLGRASDRRSELTQFDPASVLSTGPLRKLSTRPHGLLSNQTCERAPGRAASRPGAGRTQY